MCFGKPFDGVYLAFSDSSSVGRTTTAIAVIEGVTGSIPVYPINNKLARRSEKQNCDCLFVALNCSQMLSTSGVLLSFTGGK